MTDVMRCDYCDSPVYDVKNMGLWVSRVCERHFWKIADMEADESDDE